MAHNLSVEGFPNIPLTDGMIVKLEARDATTDAAVTGVTSSLWSIYGDNIAVQPGDEEPSLYSQTEAG